MSLAEVELEVEVKRVEVLLAQKVEKMDPEMLRVCGYNIMRC